MTWIRFNITVASIVLATVSTALVQGHMRHRWGPSDNVRKAADRLQEFPHDFGDWHTASSSELDDDSRNQLECLSAIVRVYKNFKTGDRVTLLLILGPAGPTAVHTPEACIASREYEALAAHREVALDNGGDRFWNKRFKAKSVHGESMSVYWGWNAHGSWAAPQDARYTYAGLPFLYKAQVTSGFHGPAEGDPMDAGRRFLNDFVPVAQLDTVADLKD